MGFYTKKTWINGSAPAISAANLQVIDNQIETISNTQTPLNSGLICAPLASVPECPDGTNLYLDKFDTVSDLGSPAWSALANATVANTGGTSLDITATAAASSIQKTITAPANSTYRLRIKALQAVGTCSILKSGGTSVTFTLTVGEWKTVDATLINSLTAQQLNIVFANSVTSGVIASIDWIYIGDGTYTSLALDGSGSGNNATVYGATPVDTVAGKGLSFDGANDYVFSSVVTPVQFSFSAWFKSTGTASTLYIGGCGSSSIYGFIVFLSSTGVVCSVGNGSASFVASHTTDVRNDSLWHHVVAKMDGSTVKIYVDGVLGDTTASFTGTISYTGVTYASIAQNYALTAGRYFIGQIADPRIYNRALSAEEVWELYSKPGMARMSGPVISATATPNHVAVRNSVGQVASQAPIPATGAGNLGIMTAIDVASGATLTMPAGSGTYQWVVQTYGATVNSVKTGQTAAAASPGGTASANCTVLVWRIA